MTAGNHISTAKGGLGISGLPKRKEVRRMEKITRFMEDEEGVTLIEYGLIAALIAVALVVTLTSVKTALVTLFDKVVTALG